MADPAARINELNAARARWMADPANAQYVNPQQQPALTQNAPGTPTPQQYQLMAADLARQNELAMQASGARPTTPTQPYANPNYQAQPALNRASDGGISPGGMPVGARPQDGQMYASTGAPVGMSAVRPQAGPGIAQQIRPGMTIPGATQPIPQGAGAMPGMAQARPLVAPQTMQAMPRPAYGPSNGSADRDPGPQPMPQGYGRQGDRPAPPMVQARAAPPILPPMNVQRPNMNPVTPAPAPNMQNRNTPMGGRDFMAAPAAQPNNPRDKVATALMRNNGGR